MPPEADPIKHVVLLLMENHSFDQMLGCFKAVYPSLEGVDPAKPYSNKDDSGKTYFQQQTTERQTSPDPRHEVEHVAVQLKDNNSGFVLDYAQSYNDATPDQRQSIMNYFGLDFLPALHSLARDFAICDHWFSSLPGPTWPNRFFALTGTSMGRVNMPEGLLHPDFAGYFEQTQTTLFDRLNEKQKKWSIYFYDIPSSLILTHQRRPANLRNYKNIDKFFVEARGDAGLFPDFVFIEPKYMGIDQNDDHPPHNVMKAEKLIADVYNAVRSNPELWSSTLLVVLFDEHGGFFDHVPPPKSSPPDEHKVEYTFDRLGVRVPALLVSPWVEKQFIPNQFDHTSLLKYLIEKWGLGPLGARAAAANSIGPFIRSGGAPRKDTIPFIRVPNADLIPGNPRLEQRDSSLHQEALHSFADYLSEGMDRAEGATIGGLARLADQPSQITKMKDWLGQRLITLGESLSVEFEGFRNRRIKRTKDIITKMISSPPPDDEAGG